MAEYFIKDGGGKNGLVKVSSDQRLETEAVTYSRSVASVEEGDAYNINTGTINLTSANKSAVLYIKNNEDQPLILTVLFYIIGNSTGGSGDTTITVLRNPTAGTIVDNATAAEMPGINRNFGSNKTLSATIYKGAEGYTFTDGTKAIETLLNQSPGRNVIDVGSIDLPKGSSLGIEYTPAAGNTSLDVQFAASVFVDQRFEG